MRSLNYWLWWLFAIALLAAFVFGLQQLRWDNLAWYVVSPDTKSGKQNLLFLLGGMKNTLLMSFTAITISIALGLLIALPGLSPLKPVRAINRVYVELVRAVPILVLIFWNCLGFIRQCV